MIKNIFLVLGLTLLSLSGNAQVDEVVWGPPVKKKGSMTSIGQIGNELFMTRQLKKSMFLESFDLTEMTLTHSSPLEIAIPDRAIKSLSMNHVL